MPVIAPERLVYANVEELLCEPLQEPQYVVKDLIPQGLTLFCGSQKIGKSWMMLELCIAVSSGEAFLGFETKKANVLYLCLEDTMGRIQKRLYQKIDEGSFIDFAVKSKKIGDGLTSQLRMYLEEKPDTKLIIIDTLQKVRDATSDYSYAKDYETIATLKSFADRYKISIVVVHHLRKMKAEDVFDEVSGTTGLTGCADNTIVLRRDRDAKEGTLFSVGRDIEYQEVIVEFEDGNWKLIKKKDVETIRNEKVPEHLKRVVSFIKQKKEWRGSASELLAEIKEETLAPQVLSKHISQFLHTFLHDEGIGCEFKKTSEKRLLILSYTKPMEDGENDDDDADDDKNDSSSLTSISP